MAIKRVLNFFAYLLSVMIVFAAAVALACYASWSMYKLSTGQPFFLTILILLLPAGIAMVFLGINVLVHIARPESNGDS